MSTSTSTESGRGNTGPGSSTAGPAGDAAKPDPDDSRKEAPTRASQRTFRTVILAVIAIGLISLTGACRKEGPLERLGGKADRAVKKAGEAVEDATDKAKEGAEDAVDKVEEVVDDVADTNNEPTPTPSG